MKKILASIIVAVLLVSCVLAVNAKTSFVDNLFQKIGCNEKSKQEPINWEEINITSINAIEWPWGNYDITNTNDINTIIDGIKNIDFTNKIKSFDGNALKLLGGPQTLEINHSNGTIKIIMYNEQLVIEDSQVSYNRYCEITNDEYTSLYETVVQYRSKDYVANETEKEEIQTLLTEFKDFSYSYLECKEVNKFISSSDFITTQEVTDNGVNKGDDYEKKWYIVTGGDITTMSALTEKMYDIFTETMIDELDIENYYIEKNDKMYVSEFAGNDGGLLGTDVTYINSINQIDENTFVLQMTAYGDKDNWELPSDSANDFTVQLKRTNDGFKIDQCDIAARAYITWTYSSEDDLF